MNWTLVSIIIAISLFLIKEIIFFFIHRKKQIDFLKCLKFKINEIENMIKSYKENTIPFYKLPLIEEYFYLKNLDFKIKGISTLKLKFYINRIQDKCLIVNYMMEEIIKEVNKLIQLGKEKEIKKNKIFLYYYPKIIAIINDWQDKSGLVNSINKINSILKEQHNII
jgi:hypothetical protein